MEPEKEENLNGFPRVISYDCTEKIIEQMKNNVCKIMIGNTQGSGFFCKIPFPDKNNMLPVFITNNHNINDNLLKDGSTEISYYIKKEKVLKKLKLKNRRTYTNEKYDVTIIEIKKEDNINNYLELDDKMINDILNNTNENYDYLGETIYIIQYPNHKLSVSYGVLKKIFDDKNYEFSHICSTEKGSSGSPILNYLNNKIIGIHKEWSGKNFNNGSFLNEPIKEFINRYNKNNNIINYKNNDEQPNYKALHDLGIISYEELGKLQLLNLISDNTLKIIKEQMEKYICNLKIENQYSTGFFCKIPYKNKELHAFIVPQFVINKKLLNQKDPEILIYIKNEVTRKLKLKNRNTYANEKYDVTIIEIKKEDNINNYLELDDKIINDIMDNSNKNNEYINANIYMIHYIKDKRYLSLSFGKILQNDEYSRIYELSYNCGSDLGSSGAPIINFNNKKVIGIHLSAHIDYNLKFGTLLNFPIKDFLENF